MPISEKQRQHRKGYLGSSDVAAILGVSPWANAYDVWLEKTGKLDDEKEKSYQSAGNMFEDGVIRWAEQELGSIKTQENGEAIFRKAGNFPIGSHPDGLLNSNDEPVEAKTAGLFGPLVEVWGDPGTDRVPDRILIQDHVHMLCVNKPVCHTPVFLGGVGFVMYRVNHDHDLMSIICEKSIEFWDEYVTKDCPPPDVVPSLDFAKRMKREPGTTVVVDDIIVQNWLNSKESLKIQDEIADAAKAELLAALANNEGGSCTQGLVTYLEQSQGRIDPKRLRKEQPTIAAEYTNTTKHRVLRFKKPKPPKF